MQKFWIQTIALVLVIFAALYLNYNTTILGPMTPFTPKIISETRQLQINNVLLTVDVADTPEERAKGLSGRSFLSEGTGMLFIFPEAGKYRFWMKGMQIPLDFIFIRQGKVVDLLENISPPALGQEDSQLPVYEPLTPIDMLLEVNSGFIANRGIKVGDEARIINASPTL